MPSTAPSEASLETLGPRQQSSMESRGRRGRSVGRVYRRTAGRGTSGGSRERNLEEERIPLSSYGTFNTPAEKLGKSSGSSSQGKADEEIKNDRADNRLKMEALSIAEKQLIPRPGYGTVGHRMEVTTNSWEVIFWNP